MTAATGILSAPMVALREIVAGTAPFQAWTGTADAAAAAGHGFFDETVRRGVPSRFMLLVHGDLIRDRQSLLNGTRFQHRDGSTLVAYFRATVTDQDDESEWLLFSNAIGAIWADVELAAGQYDRRTLAVTSIELLVAPTRIVPEKRDRAGDYFEAALGFTYSRQP